MTMNGKWSYGLLSESFLILLLCVCLGLVWVMKNWASRKKEEKFPAGPMALPIIGHLHLLSALPHQSLAEVSRKHGAIVGLKLGRERCVLVSSPQWAKEFLMTHDKAFANRPRYGFVSDLIYGYQNDIFFGGYGAPWRKLKKICSLELFSEKRLRALEYVRREEIEALLRSIADLSHGGTAAVDVGKSVGEMSTKMMTRVIFSQRAAASEQGGDEDLPQVIKDMEHGMVPSIGDFVPWLSWLDRSRRLSFRRGHGRLYDIIARIVGERRQAMMQNKPPQDDFLHTLLSREMSESSHEQDALSTDQVKAIIHDMIAGSIHTTALALEWAMGELLKNPHCLAKLQAELDNAAGKKEQIHDADIQNLKYLKCVVKEVFRLHPLGPLLIPRLSTEECRVGQYIIPAKTQLLVNVWAMGRDEQIWHNANQFDPERFVSNNINIKGQHFELLPFGGGRRMCLGLPLALAVVEVTLANLVYKFDWKLPPGITIANMDMKEKIGLTLNKATPTVAIPKLRV